MDAGPGQGDFFADKMPNHKRLGFENGNYLSSYSLPDETLCFTQKYTAAFAYLGGRHPLPITTAGVIILSAKKSPWSGPAHMCYFRGPGGGSLFGYDAESLAFRSDLKTL